MTLGMRFLADESCDFIVVKALRDAGHNVLRVADLSPGAEDPFIIDFALRERRIFLTEDKDFGRLIYAHGLRTSGVMFLRYPFFARRQISSQLVQLVSQQGEKLTGAFVTLQLVELVDHRSWRTKTIYFSQVDQRTGIQNRGSQLSMAHARSSIIALCWRSAKSTQSIPVSSTASSLVISPRR